jgi:hypothetical protein
MASQYTVRAERARQQALPISAPRGASNAPPGRAATHMQGLKSLSFCPLPAHACLLAPARGGLGWQWRAVQGAACERDAPTARAIFSAVSCTLAPPITPNPCSNPCTPPAHPQHCPPPPVRGERRAPGPMRGQGARDSTEPWPGPQPSTCAAPPRDAAGADEVRRASCALPGTPDELAEPSARPASPGPDRWSVVQPPQPPAAWPAGSPPQPPPLGTAALQLTGCALAASSSRFLAAWRCSWRVLIVQGCDDDATGCGCSCRLRLKAGPCWLSLLWLPVPSQLRRAHQAPPSNPKFRFLANADGSYSGTRGTWPNCTLGRRTSFSTSSEQAAAASSPASAQEGAGTCPARRKRGCMPRKMHPDACARASRTAGAPQQRWVCVCRGMLPHRRATPVIC